MQVGADLCMGSLIKNPGGTIATGGGYVAGKAHLVAAAQARLTAPGVGIDAGCVPGDTVRLMMQGTSTLLHCFCCSWQHHMSHDVRYLNSVALFLLFLATLSAS